MLGVDGDNLTAIANAIRQKGGTNSRLVFPAGFVSALQNIETEATVTPKIAPQQVVLTPNAPSFAIQAGFHDGTGTADIDTVTGSANPSSQQQEIIPPNGKFFSRFSVGGLGAGTQVATGTISMNGGRELIISGLGFTPVGIAVLMLPNTTTNAYRDEVFDVYQAPNVSTTFQGADATNVSGSIGGLSSVTITFSTGRASVYMGGTIRFYDTLFYVVWGS